MRRPLTHLAASAAILAMMGCSGDDATTPPPTSAAPVAPATDATSTSAPEPTSSTAAPTTAAPTTAAAPTTNAPTTTPAPMEPRAALIQRLSDELADADLAASVVASFDDATIAIIEQSAEGDIVNSPLLSYTPATVPDADVDTLWIFSFGYRFTDEALAEGFDASGAVPPPDALAPGPVNEALARIAAEFVETHPVPVIAQWEVAQLLADMGVEGVISVEPDVAADGTVTYLSTAGVAAKGLQLAADAGLTVGQAGVLCFADHAVRCVMTAEAAAMTAAVPDGAELPSEYDPESGQPWTRSRAAFVPTDLLARTALA